MKLHYFLNYIKNYLNSQKKFKVYVVIIIINAVLNIFIETAIWIALYDGKSTVLSSNNTAIDINDMIVYAVISMFISLLLNSTVVNNINNKVVTGQISIDLIRPFSLLFQITVHEFANVIFNLVFSFLPMVIISIILYGFQILELSNLALFLLTILNSVILYFLINCCIGFLAFWFINVGALTTLLDGCIKLLSGAFIPLWFINYEPVLFLFDLLPFKLIYYFPISVYLSKISYQEFFGNYFLQFIWIILLGFLTIVIWFFGRKKIMIQGG